MSLRKTYGAWQVFQGHTRTAQTGQEQGTESGCDNPQVTATTARKATLLTSNTHLTIGSIEGAVNSEVCVAREQCG